MSITISIPEKPILRPKIVVFGVGGGGCNAVNNMIHSNLEGVDFVVANTDAQSLAQNDAERSIQMGAKRTQGLGAGSHPEIGFEAAEEVIGDISDAIHGAHMVFVTAGMGGGTGTGAAPVVARLAKEMGALTVGVVTKPFMFEGNRRMAIAESGIEEMQKYVDTLLIIPNQNLFRVSSEQTALTEAFAMADRVLFSAVAGITNLMVRPGMINLDFADVRTVMGEMGKAMIGTGEAEGEKRGIEAAEHALNNPLLDDVSMKGARGVLISISGDEDMKLYEVEEAANRIRSEVDPDAQIIFGATTDPTLGGLLRISVVATGIDQEEALVMPDEDDEHSSLALVGGTNEMEEAPTAQLQPAMNGGAPKTMNQDAPSQNGQLQEVRPQGVRPQEVRTQPFQIVPPVQSAQPPQMTSSEDQEPRLAAIAEEQSLHQETPDDVKADMKADNGERIAPPPPPNSDTGPAAPHLAQSVHPFEASLAGPQIGASPHGASPQIGASPIDRMTPTHLRPLHQSAPQSGREDHAPKGFFGRVKAWLSLKAGEENLSAQQTPSASAASAASAASLGQNAHQPPSSAVQKTSKDGGDEQLEIPSFLKSQAN